jgi:hypothetical protein
MRKKKCGSIQQKDARASTIAKELRGFYKGMYDVPWRVDTVYTFINGNRGLRYLR